MAVCPQVVVPTRVGQGYVFEAPPPEQDEYDIPRHLLAPGPQDIYDVPPVRGLLPGQCSQEVGVRAGGGVLSSPCLGHCAVQAWPGRPWGAAWGPPPCPQVALAPALLHLSCPQVYDTPPMAVKGPNGRDPSLDVYDVPPSVEKGLLPASHHAVSAEGMLQLHRVLGVTVCALRRGPAEQGLQRPASRTSVTGVETSRPSEPRLPHQGRGSFLCRAFSRRFLRGSQGMAGGPQHAPSKPGFFSECEEEDE